MGYSCKDKCRNEKQTTGKKRPYSEGWKRCDVCEKWIETIELRCYCCHVKLRMKATRSKSRHIMTEMVVRY